MPLDAATLAAQVTLTGLGGLLLYTVHRLRRLEERVARIEKGAREQAEAVERLAAGQARLNHALAAALTSLEAEEALDRVRRRRRRRYIVFHVVTDGEPPEPGDVEKAVLKSLERLAGQLTVALGNVQLVYYQPDTGAGIIACTHDTKYLVLAAMGLVRRIGGRRAVLVPVRTTGTIKRARRALGLTLREMKG